MKRFGVLVLVLFFGSSFAEEDYPIEFTCEVGNDILYFNIGDSRKTTWMKAHPSSRDKNELTGNVLFYGKKWQKEFPPRKSLYRVAFDHIRMSYSVGGLPGIITINRITGRINITVTVLIDSEGQCFKGFKDYSERKF